MSTPEQRLTDYDTETAAAEDMVTDKVIAETAATMGITDPETIELLELVLTSFVETSEQHAFTQVAARAATTHTDGALSAHDFGLWAVQRSTKAGASARETWAVVAFHHFTTKAIQLFREQPDVKLITTEPTERP